VHTQSLGSRRVGSICRLLTLVFQVETRHSQQCVFFFGRRFATLRPKKKKAMKTPKKKFRKNPETSPVFEEFFMGLTSFRQSALPCRQYVEGFPEFSTCSSDLSPNLTEERSRGAWVLFLHFFYFHVCNFLGSFTQ
jgi:hypothetical protein